jgi:predicted GNAT superfamily acetyltransferase
MSEAASGIVVRELLSNEECRAAVTMQREIWGFEIGDIVPASLFHVVSLVGGLGAGAFDANDRMLGFVFGVTGIRGEVLSHWSHMLGVREDARNVGIGRMLKKFQRTTLGRLGVARIYWTFDPLQAKNAYFNLQTLGAQIDEYVPDMYGDTGSPLHFGLPTDRLIVYVRTVNGGGKSASTGSYRGVPILTAFPRSGDVLCHERPTSPAVLIEVPADIVDVARQSRDDARTWRLSLRRYFDLVLASGYVVSAVQRDADSGRSFYVAVPRSTH